MFRNFYKIVFLLLFLSLSFSIRAQELRVSAVLDSSKMRIGEQVKLDLYVSYKSDQKKLSINWPSIGDTLTSSVEVISVSGIDTTIPDKTDPSMMLQHQQLLLSVYDSGFYAIPPFKFIINNDTAHAQMTEALFLEVHTIPTDSSAKKLKDIKPPFDETFNWKWYLSEIYWTVGILFAIGGLILFFYFRSLRNKPLIAQENAPKIPPHITALATLDEIKVRQIWKENRIKEYYSEISDALRLYIEHRFELNALESTTDEIMLAFRSQVVDTESKDKLKQVLTLSDLVKFAKQFPVEAEHYTTLQQAYDFVNGTKREEEVTLPEETPSNEINA